MQRLRIKRTITRVAMTLVVMLFTTATAGAGNVAVTLASDFGTKTDGTEAKSGYYTLTDGNTYTLQNDVDIDGYLSIPSGTTVIIDLNGHTLNRGLNSSTAMGSGYVMNVKGSLTLNDSQGGGTVTGGHTTGIGAGVYVSGAGATFTMNGGCITGNKQADSKTQSGGGVSVRGGATFTMNGGSITNNTTTKNGGGVFVETATFTMNGGTISGNKCPNSYDGAGVYVYHSTLNDNHATFNVSGSAIVTGNTKGTSTTDNVYLCDNAIINVTGALTNSANIGVRMAAQSDFFAQGSGYTLTVSDASRFSSDVSGYHSALDSGKGKLYLSDKDPALLSVLTWNDDGKFFAIADEQDLIDLAEYVRSASDHNCEGLTFKMTADLDFTDMPDNYHDKYDRGSGNFLPIGIDVERGGSTFKGHFDGDGHTITGLRFDYPYTSVGLFCAIASAYAVVEGVTLVSPNFSAYNDVGGIAGGLQQGIIRNCAVVGGTLSVSNKGVGGIVGFSNYYNSSSIKSISGCTVVGTTVSGTEYVGIIVGSNSSTSDANAALTISGCKYHNPAGLDVCGYGYKDRYTDGGGNKRVYQARLSDGLTAATAAYSHGHDYYFTEGTAVTLGHGDRPGYDFGGYESSDVTISEGAFEMPASDVTVGATWTLHDYTITYDLAGGTADNVTTYNIESDAITLTNPTRTGYDFAGWTGTDLDDATETVTIDHGSTGDRSYTATWTENVLELANATDNTDIIADAAASGKTYNRVTLQGRTLYKDGAWNTICLPFDVTIANSPLSGDDVVAMTLNTQSSGLSGTTLTLYFDNAPATIPAGTPFIIKWGTPESHPNSDLNNPVFTGVTIDNTASTEVAFTGGTFKGTYSPITWSEENKSILFVGAGNTLYYPEAGGHVNACRAYFDLGSASAREFVLNFGEEGEVNGVKEVNATLGVNDDSWYTLNGVKLSGKPTKAGLYIHNGKKVIIK